MRRRLGEGSSVSAHLNALGINPLQPTGTDTAAIITALGGNSNVLGFYDARYNYISGTGTWSDYRGNSGFGPDIVAGTTKPVYSAGAGTLSFTAATTNNMVCNPVSAVFNIQNPMTFFMVASIVSGADPGGLIGTGGAEQNTLGLDVLTSKIIAQGYGFDTMTGTVAPSATVRLLVAGGSGAGLALSLDIPNQARITQTAGTRPAVTSAFISIGAVNTVSTVTAAFTGVVYACGVLNEGPISAPHLSSLFTWASTFRSAVAA